MSYAEQDKDKVIYDYWPHYSRGVEFASSGGVMVFGKEVKGMTVEYADRLREWDRVSSDFAYAALENAGGFVHNTAAETEAYLTAYYNRPVNLHCVWAGYMMNGYPWQCYGFSFLPEGAIVPKKLQNVLDCSLNRKPV